MTARTFLSSQSIGFGNAHTLILFSRFLCCYLLFDLISPTRFSTYQVYTSIIVSLGVHSTSVRNLRRIFHILNTDTSPHHLDAILRILHSLSTKVRPEPNCHLPLNIISSHSRMDLMCSSISTIRTMGFGCRQSKTGQVRLDGLLVPGSELKFCDFHAQMRTACMCSGWN